MTRLYLSPCLAALCLLMLTPRSPAAVSVGDTPKLAFTALDGSKIDLKDYQGRIVVVDFWATWCGPCMAEAGHMVATNQKLHDEGLQIIGISLDQNRSSLERVVKEKGFDWPQFFDGKGWQSKYAGEWGVDSIPRTFILDTTGKVVWTGHPAALDQPLERAFKSTPPMRVDPETEKLALSILDRVDAALSGNDSAAAMTELGAMPEGARAGQAVKSRLDAMEDKLAAAAQDELDRAARLVEQKDYIGASQALTKVKQAMPNNQAGTLASRNLADLEKIPEARDAMKAARATAKAEEALSAADKLKEDGKDEAAYVKYKSIVAQFAGTESAGVAAKAVAEYEKDPAFVQRANESAAREKAAGILSLASSYSRAGLKDKARSKYQEVVDQFPGTSFAEKAKKELDALH